MAPVRPHGHRDRKCFFRLDLSSFWLASLCFGGWLLASGIVVLEVHASRPGDAGTPSPRWPEGSPIPRVGSRPTLLIFLHPCCPCSRASVAELAHIMSRAGWSGIGSCPAPSSRSSSRALARVRESNKTLRSFLMSSSGKTKGAAKPGDLEWRLRDTFCFTTLKAG